MAGLNLQGGSAMTCAATVLPAAVHYNNRPKYSVGTKTSGSWGATGYAYDPDGNVPCKGSDFEQAVLTCAADDSANWDAVWYQTDMALRPIAVLVSKDCGVTTKPFVAAGAVDTSSTAACGANVTPYANALLPTTAIWKPVGVKKADGSVVTDTVACATKDDVNEIYGAVTRISPEGYAQVGCRSGSSITDMKLCDQHGVSLTCGDCAALPSN